MDLSLNGQNYKTAKLPTMESFHVARRLAPAIFAMGSGVMASIQAGVLKDAIGIEALGPLVGVIASMSNEDSQFVLDNCLAVCHRQQVNGWAPVFIAGGGLAFQDIGLREMLRLVIAVIQDNLGNFLDVLQIQPSETANPPQG